MVKKGGGEFQDFPSEFFCLKVRKISVGESFSVSLISGIGNIYASEGYVTIFDFLSKFFCLSAEKLRKGTLLCFTNFGYRKILCFRGLCHDFRFSVEIFLSHSAEKFGRGELFSVSLISGTEKVWIRGGRGSIKKIFRRSFCLTVPKHFIGKHFGVVSEKFFYRKFSCIGGAGGITVLSELFVSQHRNEKLCKGTLLFSGNFLVSKKNYG